MGIEGLEYQLVDVKFVQGLDTRTDQKLLIPGKWRSLNNCGLSIDGAVTKRDGHVSFSATTFNGLAALDSQLLGISGTGISTIPTPTVLPSVTAVGQLGSVELERRPLLHNQNLQDSPDCAVGSGIEVYVWRERSADITGTGGVALQLSMCAIESATGAFLMPPTTVVRTGATAAWPRVVYSLGVFFIFYVDSATTTLYGRTYRPNAAALDAETALVVSVSLNTTTPFDAARAFDDNAPSVGLVYGWTDGVTTVRALNIGDSGTVPVIAAGPTNIITDAQLAAANLHSLSCGWVGGTYFWVVSRGAGGTAMSGTAAAGLTSTWAFTLAAVRIDANIPTFAGKTTCLPAYDASKTLDTITTWTDESRGFGATGATAIRRAAASVGGGIIVPTTSADLIVSAIFSGAAATPLGPAGPFICGKAFDSNYSTGIASTTVGVVVLPCCTYDAWSPIANVSTRSTQATVFYLDGGTGAVVGKALYGSAGVPGIDALNVAAPTNSAPCSSAVLTTGQWVTAVLELSSSAGTTLSGAQWPTTGLCRLVSSPRLTTGPVRTQFGSSVYLAGGSLSTFDGRQAVEAAPLLAPEGVYVANAAGAGAMTAGTHSVVAVYEYTDSNGRRFQSAPSLPVAATSAAGDRLIVAVPTLHMSQLPAAQRGQYSIALYMTQAGGTIFNRILSTPNVSVTVIYSTITVSQADTTFASNELLYTQPFQSGSTLPADPPGPCTALCVHQGRVFKNLTDRPGAFEYSQQIVDGVGPQFSVVLRGQVPTESGGIVGLASLDEKLILLCARKLYAVIGTGPTSSGAYSNYSDPIEIPGDVGCHEARSILKMPMGLIFKAAKGWHLLGRDLTVRYIGEAVYAYDSQSVTSAVLLEDRKECRFTTDGINKYQLIYSYLVDQWSTALYGVVSAQGAQQQRIADAIWSSALNAFVSTSIVEGVARDVAGSTFDTVGVHASVSIPITAQTGFMHLGSLNSFQRVRWLYFSSNGAPGGSLTVRVDYDDTYAVGGTSFFTINLATVYAASASTQAVDWRHKLSRQKCKSIALTFTETPSSSADGGLLGITSMALQIGMKRGTNKLTANATV